MAHSAVADEEVVVLLRSVPNLLGIFRILATPIMVWLVLQDTSFGYYGAITILLLMAASDIADGPIARRLGVVSPLGVFLDTISDKIFVAGALIPMVQVGLISSWIALVVIVRDFAVSGLRSFAAAEGVVISARQWGKQKLVITVVAIVWVPFRRSAIGRAAYAVGSSEVAAYMSGVPVNRAKFVAYTLSGLLASIAGLFVTFITYTGEASAANGNTYTLYSIAAVVLGGVSLFGGSGSAIGAIFGALMFRTIGDLLFVFNVEPLWQPLFQGMVLLAAVCLGSVRLLRIRNRLDLYG